MQLSQIVISPIVLSVLASAHAIPRSGSPLTQAEAEARLTPDNIKASSSGGCTDKNTFTCTSFDGILSGTVDGVITLKNAAGVSGLTITGGTETGHASGEFSHSKGFKVDVRHDGTLDDYITGTFTQIEDRGDGFPQWKAPSGNLYCDEGSHWDITFF